MKRILLNLKKWDWGDILHTIAILGFLFIACKTFDSVGVTEDMLWAFGGLYLLYYFLFLHKYEPRPKLTTHCVDMSAWKLRKKVSFWTFILTVSAAPFILFFWFLSTK